MIDARRRDALAHGPVAMALVVAGGTLAYADPVRFENDGSFDWQDNLFLDITKGVSKQAGAAPGPGTFLYYRIPQPYGNPQDPMAVRGGLTTAEVIGHSIYGLVVAEDSGAVVPSDFVIPRHGWGQGGLLGYYYTGGFFNLFDDSKPFGVPGDPGYIAARFVLDGQTHYGWISLTLTHFSGPVPNWVFDLVAWGYETEPNTPIEAGAVPAPSGALALLAFGAAAGATRARRE